MTLKKQDAETAIFVSQTLEESIVSLILNESNNTHNSPGGADHDRVPGLNALPSNGMLAYIQLKQPPNDICIVYREFRP